ncbi:hypothetical protein PYS58_06410 [Chryseobacterium indologenes]|uniref:hypothetical protein n=1 Tax=Chryseobacterium indologenes TaxID=253 RepID=UPI0023E8AB99|nr:hypothetical protein [Chryseobacterium indologenes]WET50761.1 hypothetical protein PYS58_06410 [Chryseobacterium indologenes]
MKILKIYSTFATIAIITLSVVFYQSNTKLTNSEKKVEQKETVLQQKTKLLKETEEVLEQCSERYYKQITQ